MTRWQSWNQKHGQLHWEYGQKDPVAPWDWRHGLKKSEAKKENQLTGTFHGNVNSRIFHRQGCRYYDCSNCTVIFDVREQAIQAGFRPCKICNP
ncbi:MAG: Ada metal-binding domain-containing protein [Pseudomonadota bacterium]